MATNNFLYSGLSAAYAKAALTQSTAVSFPPTSSAGVNLQLYTDTVSGLGAALKSTLEGNTMAVHGTTAPFSASPTEYRITGGSGATSGSLAVSSVSNGVFTWGGFSAFLSGTLSGTVTSGGGVLYLNSGTAYVLAALTFASPVTTTGGTITANFPAAIATFTFLTQ